MSDYCLDIVRRHDPDRFLLSLFAPRVHRPALWALFAFHYEIAKTREVVSETTIGLIRLQWWREAIEEIYEDKTVRPHEVLDDLKGVIKAYDLPRELFDNLIYAREFDLEDVIPANIEGLLNYCEYTNAPLMKLGLKIMGDEDNDTVVVDISRRYGLIGVIRAVPYRLKSRRMLLPQDILDKYDVSVQKMCDFNEKGNLDKVIEEVFERSKGFRNDKSDVSLSQFLRKVAHMSKIYEAQLKSVGFDVFDQRMSVTPKFMALRLLLGV